LQRLRPGVVEAHGAQLEHRHLLGWRGAGGRAGGGEERDERAEEPPGHGVISEKKA